MKLTSFLLILLISFTIHYLINYYKIISKRNSGHPLHHSLALEFGRFLRRYTNSQVLERINITIKDDSIHKNMTIVHLTDLHFSIGEDDLLTKELLDSVIKSTNEINPDYVMLTGDFVHWDGFKSGEIIVNELSKIKSKKFVVLGSHDGSRGIHGYNNMIKLFKKSNFTVLNNEIFYDNENKIQILGFGSLLQYPCQFKPEKMIPHVDNRFNYTIALSHNPDTVKCLIVNNECNNKVPINLMLSGHKHGGQIIIPFTNTSMYQFMIKVLNFFNYCKSETCSIFGFSDSSRYKQYSHGLYKFKSKISNIQSYFYISKGIGSHLGLRMNCRPELTVIYLLPKN